MNFTMKTIPINKKKPYLVGEAPFSGFYTRFYFVPLYALEQMYYGVSDSSRYFSYNLLIKINGLDKKRKYKNDFYPVPNLHFSKLFFHKYFYDFLLGKKNFFFFKPNTFFYDFLLGLFFFIIWQLGGGFRLSPLFDPQKKLNVFGFYDLRFTPLATIFKFLVKISFFFGFFEQKNFRDYYLFNKNSLTRGFLAPYLIHEKENWGKQLDPIFFFLFPVISFFPELVFTTLFHFFFRIFFYYYVSFVGSLAFKYESKITLFDHFWIQLYAYYIEDVCSLLRLTRVRVEYASRLVHIATLSTFFYFNSIKFKKYFNRRIFRIFSFYGVREFAFSIDFSRRLYKMSEIEKMDNFKTLVLKSTGNLRREIYKNFLPEPGFFYNSHFQNFFFFKPLKSFENFFSIKNLIGIAPFSRFNPHFNRTYIKRFRSPVYVISELFRKAINPHNKSNLALTFRNYKYKSRWLKFHFENHWPYRFYYALSFRKLFLEISFNLLHMFFRFIGFFWILPRYFSIFNKIVYSKNAHYKPYSFFFEKTNLSSYNFIFKFLGFFFFQWFGKQGFDLYQIFILHLIAFVKLSFNFILQNVIKIVVFLYGWYSYFFWIFFRPILTLFYYFYLEIRFFFIFYLEYLKYYHFYYQKFYYFSIIKSYYITFQKFFIGSKFFRFFTREIGEDLEESVYNNSQDFETDSEVLNYIIDFPAYEDFQSNPNNPDQGYLDSDVTQFFDNQHYFDFWTSSDYTDSYLPIKPNLEFFAENFFEQENDIAFQLFCVWSSPTLNDFVDFNTTLPVYEYKDDYDASFYTKPDDWYPLELVQSAEFEEDHLEYFLDGGSDGSTDISEAGSTYIVPFDSDRAKLSKFSKFYIKKLRRWHSYQTTNNFLKLPDSLKYFPIPDATLPKNFDQWQKATRSLSTIFFSPKEIKSFKFKFETFNDLSLVWSRIDYELQRNPQKIYDFISDSKFSSIFDDFFETKKSSKNHFSFFKFFNSKSPHPNFLRYLNDYFSGYADLAFIEKNSHYRSRTPFVNIFVINYFYYLATTDNKNFMQKFWILSSYPQFAEFKSAFEIFTKHKPAKFNIFSSKETFLEEIYNAQVKSLSTSQNFSPMPPKDYWNEDDGAFLWLWPRELRPNFSQWRNWFRFRKPKFFYKKKRKKKKKNKKLKKINKNDLLKVFFDWCRHEQKILYWRFSGRGNRDHYNQRPYTTQDKLRSVTFENIFSSFVFDSFSSFRHKSFKAKESFIFRAYKPGSIYYYYTDGEDDSAFLGERKFSSVYHKRRSYFSYSQLIQGSVWSALNPFLDDFFYETYYINNNLFFPSSFSDHFYSDFFNDDPRDSGLDIYDEYIFIGGVKDYSRNLAEGSEDLIASPDEYGDEDTDSVGFLDETEWKEDELMDFESSADDGIGYGHETDGENAIHFNERFWFNSDWFFYNEHVDGDEGLEEWEPDEFDSFYDVDHGVDRLFFGALRRENHFPATDPRIFFGAFWEHKKNIDVDLDYSENFNLAKSNSESKQLVVRGISHPSSETRNYFNHTRLIVLACYRLFLYFVYGLKSALITIFFSNFDNSKYFKLLNCRSHYLKWYAEYSAPYTYKNRVLDWLTFFEKFKNEKIFYNYKNLNKKLLISEPTSFNFLDDPYGRFWLQFPFNNHLQNFSYYTSVNLLETDYAYEDLDFTIRGGKAYLDPEKKIDTYQTDTSLEEPGSDLSGINSYQERAIYKNSLRFFSSDPTWSSPIFRSTYASKLDKISSFPWFADRTKSEVVGSDFTYLDLMFVDDIPEDDEFIDEDDRDDDPLYPHATNLYTKVFDQTRYGSIKGPYIPNDGVLDGFSFEESDWDIGSLSSFSSDDFNTHLEDFSEKYDIYSSAFFDWYDLVYDYFKFYFQSKLRKFVFAPFRYVNVQINSEWLKLAATYGIWVLIFRNFFNLSLFIIFFIYGFFSFSRMFYYLCGEFFGIGPFNFIISAALLIYTIFLLRFFFKPVNDFYKSVDIDEKIAFYTSFVIFFYLFNLNGYVRNPTYFAFAGRGGSSTTNKLFISNNFSPDVRRIATDWYLNSGFKHRPELNRQGWIFNKTSPIRPRYFPEIQHKKDFVKHVNPDRQVYPYNYGFASYPTYFNPHNIWNFIKFHVFNIVNDNVVGYTQFPRVVERNNARNNLLYTHMILHRPELVNWLHITNEDSELAAKEEILEQGLYGVKAKTLYVYYGVAKDRKKYHNVEFVNPLNQARVWTPYRPLSHPHSFLPYDFRPKFINDAYDPRLHKINSVVQSNYVATLLNAGIQKVDPVPELCRTDKHTYKNVIDADGTYVETIRSRKYRRSAYFSFGKKQFFKKQPTFYDTVSKNNWIYQKLFQKSFLYNYSINFRKYIFYFNPNKSGPIRDAYGLAFKDLVPYPEILGHGKNKMLNPLQESYDFLKFLPKKQKEEFFKLVELETLESAAGLLNHLTYYPKSGYNYSFYFDSRTSTRFKFNNNFFDEYARVYNRIFSRVRGMATPTDPIHFKDPIPFYYPYDTKVYLDNCHHQIRDSISNLRLKSLDNLTNFFQDYQHFKNQEVESVNTESDLEELRYRTKVAQTNRIRRSKILSGYFKAVKAANKQSQIDYFRDSMNIINPYKFDSFSIYSDFTGHKVGINRKNVEFEDKVLDPFFSKKNKHLNYRSSRDDRLGVYSSDINYINPVFDIEKRFNRRFHRRRVNYNRETRYSYGWYEYRYIEASLWNIFLDFIMVRDIIEHAEIYEAQTFENSFEYKFNDFSSNRSSRKVINDLKKSSVILLNTMVEKKSSKLTPLTGYFENQANAVDALVGSRWEAEYDDHDFVEALPRFRYAEKIAGVENPNLKSDRFNFRTPNFFQKKRFFHWLEVATQSPEYERHRKPYFGVSIREEADFYFAKKYIPQEWNDFPYLTVPHALNSYIWFSTLQRSRILYNKSALKKSFPYNQRFIEIFEKSKGYISNRLDDVSSPMRVTHWKRFKPHFAPRLPLNYMSDELALKKNPKVINKVKVFQDNEDFNYNEKPIRSKFFVDRQSFINNQKNLFEAFIKDKRNFKEFNEETKHAAHYFKYLQAQGFYDTNADRFYDPFEKDPADKQQDEFYHGLVQSDQEKGEADVILLRARRRKALFFPEPEPKLCLNQ